jgi:superfamily II DNA or RNA helicase
MALMAASEMFRARRIDRVIVVVPTDQLRRQWNMEAAKYGLDITAEYRNSAGPLTAAVHGAVVTYAQIAGQPSLWRKHAYDKPTLVVFDEIHHAGDADHTSWGPAIREAFEVAESRLLLSGTPFRTDGSRIPFVEYDGNGMSISNRGIDYGLGVKRGIVRPLRFEVHDGTAEWMDGATKVEVLISSAKDENVSRAMRTLYDAGNDWIPSVMVKANAELTRARAEMPDAGGLVLAPSRGHADMYAALMQGICGEPVQVVYSESDTEPRKVIDSFTKSSARWLVAVDMVSEGVDIPRLAVGVYASRKTTELWFRQVAGRFVRMRGDDDTMTGTVLIPAAAPLVEMAKRIESEASVALDEAVKEARSRNESEGRQITFDLVEPLAASESVLSEAVVSGVTVDDAELRNAERVQREIGGSLNAVHRMDLALALRMAGATPVGKITVEVPPSAVSGDAERLALRKQINRMVGRYCAQYGEEYAKVHGELNKRSDGGKIANADAAGLVKRLDMITEWLRS